MASAPSASLQEARKLAQSCWARCKDSPSSFKLLTGTVRKLRNTLEEVEEIYDDFRTLGPDDLKLLTNVVKASETLQQLDQALQNHRSSADIRESDVADFKTSLDVIAHQLTLAFDAVTTGEIPLQLDTSIRAGQPTRDQSTSSYAGDSALGRKSSQASSAWSSAQKDSPSLTDTGSEFEDAKIESKALSSEKEVRQARKLSFQPLSPTPSSSASEGRKPSLDWRSPFATLDPLSISLEEASSLILTPDEEDYTVSAVRSRSGTGSTVFAPAATQQQVQIISRSASNESLPEDVAAPVDLQSAVTTSPPDSPSLTRAQGVLLPPPSSSPRARRAVSIDIPPRRVPEAAYLSPASAATPAARKSRADSLSSPKTSVEDAGTHDTLKPEVAETVGGHGDEVPTITTTEAAQDLKDHISIVVPPTESSHAAASTLTDSDPLNTPPQPPHRTSTPPPTTSPHLSPAQSPPVPNRRPPPPPSPRRSKAVKARSRVSSYRVVNASPVEDESSDEDLYSASRPSSMARLATGPPVLAEISRVSILDHDEIRISSPPAAEEARDPLDLFQQPRQSLSVAESTAQAPASNEAASSTTIQEPRAPPEPQPSPTIAVEDHSDQDSSAMDEKRPTLPKRPSWIRKASDRPHIATMVSSVASKIQKTTSIYLHKETAPEPGLEVRSKFVGEGGLEVNDGIRTRESSKIIRERRSVDVVMNTTSQASLPAETAKPSTPDLRDRSASTSQVPQAGAAPVVPAVTEWYGPGSDHTELSELERERINHIVHFWNESAWDQAEAYLSDYLSSLLEQNAPARARRVRHLLGVSASLRGEWDRAIPLLLSAMRRPIHDISELDDGDCAAAYWLGDIYALGNRRTEALLAYCIAERSSFFRSEDQLSSLIALEQEAVQLGASKNDFKLRWAQQVTKDAPPDDPRSIMDTNVLTPAAAKMLFDNEPRRYNRPSSSYRDGGPFQLDGNKFRSSACFLLTRHTNPGFFHRLKIHPTHFEPHTAWPLQYDPTFCITNVRRGRLLTYECDLLAVFATNDDAKIPAGKFASKSLAQVNCFTAPDLAWLIRTIRACLRLYEMQWSEVANVEGTWFLVRYSFLLNKVATTYYFSIALFKQTLRAGYGVEICADGIGGSRVLRTTYEYERGVHSGEGKRVRKLVREFLEEAARARKGGAGSGVRSGFEQEERPPPMPPRPKRTGVEG